jgi:hypothetical protein
VHFNIRILVPYISLLVVILFILLLLPWSSLRRAVPLQQKDVPSVVRGERERGARLKPLFAQTDISVPANQLANQLAKLFRTS